MKQNSIVIRGSDITGTVRRSRDGREITTYQTGLAEGWTIRIEHASDKWSGCIWRTGTPYESLWNLVGSTPPELVAHAEDMLRPRDLGSLAPRDVGFNPRATQTAIELPYAALCVTIHVPTRKSEAGRKITGTSESVAADLRGSGYRVEIRRDHVG